MKSLLKSAFTLIELIVVITILAILGTIGFVSLQGYSVNARDSVRIADTKTFLKTLNIYQTKNGEVPLPDHMTTITGSGVVFSYQGTLSGSVITELGQGQVPVDPLLKTPYLYATNETQTKVQLLSYHEKNTSSLEFQNTLTYADTTYADMFPKTMGDEIGILLEEDNSPIASGALMLENDLSTRQYILSDSEKIHGTGATLMNHNPMVSCDRLNALGLIFESTTTKIYKNGYLREIYCDLEHGTYMIADNLLKNNTPKYFGSFESEGDLDFLTDYKSQVFSISDDSVVGKSSLYMKVGTEKSDGTYGGFGLKDIPLFHTGAVYTVEFYAKNLSSTGGGLWFSHHNGGYSNCLSTGVSLPAYSDWVKVTNTCALDKVPQVMFIWSGSIEGGEFLVDGFQVYEGNSIE